MHGAVLTIHTTTKCTLRCKDCGYHYPWFKVPVIDDINLISRSLRVVFEIYTSMEELRPGGAEFFLYPQAEQFVREFIQYTDKFNRFVIITNGTYVPKESVLKAISELQCDKLIRIDDYGKLSGKVNEFAEALEKHNIPFEIRPYNEKEQSFGGWVDMGTFDYLNYSDEELEKVFRTCRIPDDCLLLWDGRLYNCSQCAAGRKLGKIPIAPRDVVDLFDGSTIEEKRAVIKQWKDKPFLGCGYCLGFDPKNSPRVPAAIQMED